MNKKKKYWLDEPSSRKKLIRRFSVFCVLLFFLDSVYHKHVHFPIEKTFGFYAFFGFIGCVGIVLLAKELRKVLMRKENYYDE